MVEDLRQRRYEEERARKRKGLIASWTFVALVVAAIGLFAVSQLETGSGVEPDDVLASTGADVSLQTVTDSEGREVSIPEEPQAIACLDSFSGEMAIMAGAADRICGVPSGVKSDSLLMQKAPDADGWASLSGNAVNVEELLRRSCDVALVRPSLSDAERKKLSNARIPYVVVGYEDVSSQLVAMRLVGQACGGAAQESAKRIVDFAEMVVADVEARVADVPQDARMSVYHAINDVLTCDGRASLGADWVWRAGCVDVSAEQEGGLQGDYSATLEQIYAWAPDAVICNAASAARSFQAEERWVALSARTVGRVWVIPTGATRWGQRGSVETYLAMLWLGAQAYPDRFADVDWEQMVRDYYADILGIKIGDEQWAQVIAGEGIRAEGSGSGSGNGSGAGSGSGGGR